jgi:putative FmdB family regulatory protein
MPTYQYRCERCGETFEHAEHLAEHETTHPNCPKCGSEKVEHMPTPFVAKTSRKSLNLSGRVKAKSGHEATFATVFAQTFVIPVLAANPSS